ncbi:hypothetical protein B7463_g11180, partial [Scytalidium lignicola]
MQNGYLQLSQKIRELEGKLERSSSPMQHSLLGNISPPLVLSSINVPDLTSFPTVFFLDGEVSRVVIPVTPCSVPEEILRSFSELSDTDLHQIIRVYFITIHTWMPFISKLRIQQIIDLREQPADFMLLLLCMRVIVADPAVEKVTMKNSLYRLAKRFYSALEDVETVTLRMLQSLILLALYEIGHGILPAAYFTVGNAARMAQMMGIQNIDRRSFVLLGRRGQSYIIKNPSGNDYLPGDTSSWDTGHLTGNLAIPVSSGVEMTASSFARTCQAASLMGHVLSHHEDRSMESIFHTAEASQLAHTIQALASGLEYSILDGAIENVDNFKNFNDTSSALAFCYSSLLNLYKHYCTTTFAPRSSNEIAMQQEAINGRRDISRQVLLFADQLLVLMSSADQVKAISPLVIDCLYQAGVSYAQLAREGKDYQFYDGLGKIMTCLTRLSRRCPLSPERSETRLLWILPGAWDECIKCRLDTACLQDAPQYNALSYVWGNSNDTRPIEVNGEQKQVTTNLEAALRHLRALKTHHLDPLGVPIWIDSISINQADIDERNRQTSMMSEIYSRADRVIVWLGESTKVSDYVFKSINSTELINWLENSPALDLDTDPGAARRDHNIIKAVTVFWAFPDLHLRPWWSRVWVIQEVALARNDPLIVCGRSMAPWSDFVHFYELLNDKVPSDCIHMVDQSVPGICEVVDKVLIGDPRAIATRISPAMALQKVSQSGIGSRVLPLKLIVVDYRKSYMQVYHEAMILIWTSQYMIKTNFIEQLSFTGVRDDCPSWVADLSSQNLWGASSAPKPPSNQPIWKWGERARFSEDGRILKCKGILLDHVAKSVSIERINQTDTENIAHIKQFYYVYTLASAILNSPIPPENPLRKIQNVRDNVSIFDVLTMETASPAVIELLRVLVELCDQVISETEVSGEDLNFEIRLEESMQRDYWQMLHVLQNSIYGRSLIITEGMFVGVGSQETQAGDVVVFLFGMSWPWILRPGLQYYTIVGPAYLGGLSKPELFNRYIEEGDLQEIEFEIS